MNIPLFFLFFFFNDTATTEIYTLSLHDALPISRIDDCPKIGGNQRAAEFQELHAPIGHRIIRASTGDRKSTRLNSSHLVISYAVFCLKKKKHHRKRVVHHER